MVERARGLSRRRFVAVEDGLCEAMHVAQTVVDPDRARAGETALDAVVLRGVVRRGEHRARHVHLPGGVIEQVARGEAEVRDAHAVRECTALERIHELWPARAHVVGHDDVARFRERGERDTEGIGRLCVQLVRDGATNVVRLDDRIQVRHGVPR